MKNESVLDISWETIFKIALVAILFFILFQIKDILVLFLFALVISILFNPAVDFLSKYKIPRVVGTALIYFIVFGFLAFSLYYMVGILVFEIDQFSKVFPDYLSELSPVMQEFGIQTFSDIEFYINDLKGSLMDLTAAIFSASFALFGGIFTTIFILTMAFFLSLEGKLVERAVLLAFPKKYESYAFYLWKSTQKQVSGWFASRLLSCLFVGFSVYVSALVLGVSYPLSFGLIAGIFNFIPYIGPLVSGVLIFLIAIIESFPQAVFILAVFALIQLIESAVLVPVLTRKFTGLSPVLVIMALAIGGTLWGMLGALLAIPLAGIIFEFLKEFLIRTKKEETVSSQ